MVSDLATPASGSRFKVVMSHSAGDAGALTEMELWGTRRDRSPSVIRGESIATSVEGEVLFRFLPQEKGPHALELIAADSSSVAISGQLNGMAVSLSRVSVAGSRALYRADIDTADFDADELWFMESRRTI